MDDITNNLVLAADTTNVQAGGQSWFDTGWDALTKGTPGAAIAGLASIYNTGVQVANYFGADADKIDTHKAITDVNDNWGEYYAAHPQGVEAAGFLLGSILPGGLAVKGLNLIRRGEAAGAFGRALNYTTTAQTANLEKALQVIASPEGSVFSQLNVNTIKALAWGTADATLQNAAFNIAAAATMNASPIFDGSSVADISHDIIKSSLFGGVVGGGLDTLFMHGITKSAISAVDRVKGKYDTLGGLEGVGLGDSDKAFAYANAFLALPKAVAAEDTSLPFSYQLNGVKNEVPGGLKTEALYGKTLQKTADTIYLRAESQLTNGLADGDTTVGRPLSKMVVDIMKQGKDGKVNDDALRARLGDYLLNLQKVGHVGELTVGDTANTTGSNIMYLNRAAKSGEIPLTTEATNNSGMYRVSGPVDSIKMAILGKDARSAADAWTKDFDIAQNVNGGWSVNPRSTRIRATTEPTGNQGILNIVSGEVNDKATVTAADIATADAPLVLSKDGVTSGGRSWKFATDDSYAEELGHDSVDATARHAWAGGLSRIEGTVSSADYSVLDKMSASPEIVRPEVQIAKGADVRNWRDFGNFQEFVFNNKVEALKERLSVPNAEEDIQKLAYEFNTTPSWIQDLIASKFNTQLKRTADNAPDLSSGWQRPFSTYSERENLLMTYSKAPALYMDDFGNTFQGKSKVPQIGSDGKPFLSDQEGHRAFITGEMAYNYRVQMAKDNLNAGFKTTFGEAADRFLPFSFEDLEGLANRNATGAGLISFSNASYGDKLRLFSGYTGKQVDVLTKEISTANLSRLQPFIAMFRADPRASAELTAITTRLRSSPEKFQLLGADYGLDGSYLIERSLIKRGSTDETLAAIKDAAATGTQGNQKAFKIESDLVSDFLNTHQSITSDLVQKRATLAVARGETSNKDPNNLFIPAIDTRKVPFFALVRAPEGKLFSDSNVSMISARSSQELSELTARIDPSLQVIYKGDTKEFFKAKGDYDYSRGLNESAIDSSLRREGKLGDYMPSFNTESTLEDFINFHQQQAAQLVRDGVSTKYAQTFSELTRKGEQYTLAQGSKFEPLNKLVARSLNNPYDDVIKESLNLSKRSEFTILNQTNEVLDAMGTRAYRAVEGKFQELADSRNGTQPVDWETGNSMLQKYGLGQVFKDEDAFNLAKTPIDGNLLKTAMQKANMFLSTATLRLDAAHAIVHTISSPILMGMELSAIRNSVKDSPELMGALSDLTTVAIPGSPGIGMPSTLKLISGAVKNWFGPDKDAFIQRLSEIGIFDAKKGADGKYLNLPAEYHSVVNQLSIMPSAPNAFMDGAKAAVEFGAKWSGNNFAESFSRFVAADVMRQLTQPLVAAGRMGEAEQNAFMNTFVNRVQGNYLTSQRPILFQGTLGSALGLFQTYHLNMLQQIFRHIEDRNYAALAVGAGLQTSIFGLDGLPLFNGINTNLLGTAAINTGHNDAYSSATLVAGKEMGDWLMYGTASALPIFGQQGPALYSRGQIAPRFLTVIPTTPQEIPAVNASIGFVKNLINTSEKIQDGGNFLASILQGLEHNSINRPLAGLAQIIQGFSTTSKGELIAPNQDLFSIANASRLLGAKPLDEAVGLNTKFRLKSYEAEDKAKIETLGEAVKTTLVNGGSPTDEQMISFMGKYAASGGRIQTFGKKMQEWSKESNTSVLNNLSDKVGSNYGQRFVDVMGGTRMPLFNAPDPGAQQGEQQ